MLFMLMLMFCNFKTHHKIHNIKKNTKEKPKLFFFKYCLFSTRKCLNFLFEFPGLRGT